MSENQCEDGQEQGLIDFGAGGLILNTPQNERLLGQIQETPPLQSEALLKLAIFYKGFPTNVSLGNHLALLAASMREEDFAPARVFPEYTGLADFIEDEPSYDFPFRGDGGDDEGTEHEDIRLGARRVVVSGVGLLVETLTIIDEGESTTNVTNWHFVIGVSPSPDNLPFTAAKA